MELHGKQSFHSEKTASGKAEQNALPGIVISHQQKAIAMLGSTILPRNYLKCICGTLRPMSCNILSV